MEQIQHDAYGSVILSAVPMFFDKRLPRPGRRALVPPGGKDGAAMRRAGAGARCRHLGISRPQAHPHPFRPPCAGPGLSRAGAIAARLGFSDRAQHWNGLADQVGDVILERCWNEKRQAFTAAIDIDDMDASVLLLPELGLIDSADPRFASHGGGHRAGSGARPPCAALCRGGRFRPAGIRIPGLPLLADRRACACWAAREEARDRFKDALALRNHYGLFAEDINPQTGALWGNFPQTYSMAGLILSAMRLSKSWEERYWHASS